jgi:peptidoglycan hydrolase-like protein with peptidoglycan-binding domain
MSPRETIAELIRDKSVSSILKRRSAHTDAVQALQTVLFELGFGSELNWERYGADGDYGGGTAQAVKEFARRNNQRGDGEQVSVAIAKRLIARHDILDDLRHLHNAVEEHKVEQFYYRGSPHSPAVAVLQTLLNELGFGEQLNWEKYGADGKYGGGTTRALKAFARQEGIRGDGRRLTVELAERIIARLKGFYGDGLVADVKLVKKAPKKLSIREAVEGGKTRIYVSAGGSQVRLTRYKKGAYFYGRHQPLDFIDANRSSLNEAGLTDSAINVMVAVSENEGNLDAVNTWDNSFMTFGMFQWTAGARSDPGELAALLQKIKDADAAVFQNYFGRHGLEIANASEINGYFALDGQRLANPMQKERLRTYEWAFYFWLAGQDPLVQSIEVQHALARINTFYRARRYRVKGYDIADLVTSEYGMGLLLDNHVNRPGYIKPCLEKAMDQTGLRRPQNWGTAAERKLIKAYLKIRETHGRYPMTHAARRAAVTKKYLNNGTISDERGSFQFIDLMI